MRESIYKFRSTCGWPDNNQGFLHPRICERETFVRSAFSHLLLSLNKDIIRSIQIIQNIKNRVIIVPVRSENEASMPSPNIQITEYHIYSNSSQKIGSPFVLQSTTKWSNAFVLLPSGSSRKSLTPRAICLSVV